LVFYQVSSIVFGLHPVSFFAFIQYPVSAF